MTRLTELPLASASDLLTEIELGTRFVRYQYCVSALVVSFRMTSEIFVIRRGESKILPGIPYTLLTLVLGWWGIPHGIIFTPIYIVKNCLGGIDITADIREQIYKDAAQMAPTPGV